MDKTTEKSLRETMLNAVPYLNLNKVRKASGDLVSENFYNNFKKTISNKNKIRDFIINLNPNESDYDKMVILDRLKFGLSIDKANEITAFLKWIDLVAQNTRLRRTANWDLMNCYYLKLCKYELAIESAEKFMKLEKELENDVEKLMIGSVAILESYYHLLGNSDKIFIEDRKKSEILQQYASRGLEEAGKLLSVIETNNDIESKIFLQKAHVYRFKFAMMLSLWDTNNDTANAIINEYKDKNYLKYNVDPEFIDDVPKLINQIDTLMNISFSEETENPIQQAWKYSYDLDKEFFSDYSRNYHIRDRVSEFSYYDYFFWEQVQKVDKNGKFIYYDPNTNSYLLNTKLLFLLYRLMGIVSIIKDSVRFASIMQQNDANKPIIHYTKLEYFGDMVLPNKDKKKEKKFPIFDAAIMNDPREGAAFCDLVFSTLPDLEQFYTKNCSFFKSIKERKDIIPTFVFLKSFMFKEPKDTEHMWKRYGNNGAGVCVKFDIDTFLNKSLSELKGSKHKADDYSLYNIRYLECDKSRIDDNINYLFENGCPKSLGEEREVKFFSMLIPEGDEDEIFKMKTLYVGIQFLCITLEKIMELYPSLKKDEKIIFDKVSSHYIAQVGFLFKDSTSEKGEAWKDEKEIRLVLYRSENDKIDEKGKKTQHIYLPNTVQIKNVEFGEKVKEIFHRYRDDLDE